MRSLKNKMLDRVRYFEYEFEREFEIVNMETFIEETSMANEQHNETKGNLKISNTIIIYILVTGFVIEEYDWL